MAQFSYLICLAIGFSEPATEATQRDQLPAALRDVPAVLFGSELRLEQGEIVRPEAQILADEIVPIIEQAKKKVEANRDRHFERQAKQLIVHLAPERVKIFTPNSPAKDMDLYDKPLPADELAVICDGIEEEELGSETTWTFTGNVQIHAARFMILCCHEAKVTRTAEHLLLTVSGGRDYADDLTGLDETQLQLSHAEGLVLLAGERAADQPSDLSAGSLFPSAKIRIRLSDGKYLVRMDIAPQDTQRD